MIKNIEDFVESGYYMCRIINDNGEPDFIYYFKYRKYIITEDCEKEIDFYWETLPPYNHFKEKSFNSTLFPFPVNDEISEYIYTEVEFSDIKKYLPSGHPDIIEYRKQRIKSLLNNNL